MDEFDFYVEDNNVKSIIFKIILFFIIIVCICVGYVYYKNRYTLKVRKVTYEAGDKLSYNIEDYIKSEIVSKDDYTLNLKNVSNENGILTKVGEYTYTIKYKKITKTGKIFVQDTTSPSIETSTLYVGLNEEYSADDFLTVCDDYSKPCVVTFADESDANLSSKSGTYNFKINIEDSSKNKTSTSVTLVVDDNYTDEEARFYDFTPAKISPSYDDYDGSFLVKYNKAVTEDEIYLDETYNEFLEISSSDLHEYLDSKYANNGIKEYQSIYIYNKSDYVIGYTIRVLLDNGLVFYLKN